MIRDGNVDPHNITIFEALKVPGGSCDGSGVPDEGYMIRGGRMLNLPAYECLWDLMKFIPSIENPEESLYDETYRFNQENKTHSNARLVDHNLKRVDVTNMGFNMKQRLDLLRLINTPEEKLGNKPITEFFDDDFFKTSFWYMWSTTFAFQTWHSAAELRRYCIRLQHEFLRIHTLEGVARTVYNQYDSLVLPIQRWLEQKEVNFVYNTVVIDVDLKVQGNQKTVVGLTIIQDGKERKITLGSNDYVILQNGSMTDGAGLGTMTEVAKPTKPTSFQIWEKLSKIDRKAFGDPTPFFKKSIKESLWYSFTVTIKNDTTFFDQEIAFTHNTPGTGALCTFKDSNWLMSIVVPKQPHFINQPENVQVFWGYALFPDRIGNFVNKPMLECTGAEILQELIGHLGFDKSTIKNAVCRTCVMPYIDAQFMCRSPGDRPKPVPEGCTNLGLTSQFVEIPDDIVFTVEYSVRSAQMAVYELLGIKKKIPAISHHEKEIGVKVKCVKKAFAGTRWETVGRLLKLAAGVGIAVGAGILIKSRFF